METPGFSINSHRQMDHQCWADHSCGFAARLVVLLLVLLISTFCQAQPLIHLSSSMADVSTGMSVRYLEDADHAYTLEQVRREPQASRFAPLPDGKSNFGVSGSGFWLRIDLKNSGDEPLVSLLEVVHPHWDHVTFYTDGGAVQSGGDHLPIANRAVAAESNLYPVTTPSGGVQRVWVHLSYNQPGLAETKLSLWTPDEFAQHYAKRYFLIGSFIGMGVLVVFYNLLIGYSTRMPEYIWYTLYIMAAMMALLANTGLGYRYLWQGSTEFVDLAPILFSLLTLVLATQFTRSFLNTRGSQNIDRLLQSLFVFAALAMLCYLFGERGYALKLTLLYALATVLFPLIGIWRYKKGRSDARFYVLGWSVWSLAMLIAVTRNVGLIPADFVTNFSPPLGFCIEGVLLSLALADRINYLKQQKEAAELLHITHLQQEQEELERLVSERTAALEQAMKQAELLAQTDSLTGVLNRRAFYELGEKELERARRYQTPLAVVMIDLDMFKQINDNHGHATGDRVLIAAINLLQTLTRSADLFGRIGGEEFALLMPQTHLHEAAELAERLRAALEGLEVCVAALTVRVTASFGVAAIDVSNESLAEAMGRSDEALYRAKAHGRNCVELASAATIKNAALSQTRT
ncbi:diguanylate cyclase (GGDEF) domain-containing protein [Amphritea atlantica]|uniref:diguanylate cyclase n=2 Tax=Amphritea atlantica TaxID=355243 RepID=A0A1H9GJ53_9GAMM|nr:diguanylate cyclase (GGDEF) domain-containing protein [Amphritea atlantica]